MPLIDARDIIDFTQGANASDVLIGGYHFNKTTLDFWNYTLFSNGTLSNGSWCILTFEPWQPTYVLQNGTFLNVTWCYTPINGIAARAGTGLGFAVAFGLLLVWTLVNLHKHGKLYLPAEKRFFPIGRRWQWYWALFTIAAALISLITNVDVDRYFLPELPLVLNVFFWFLMQIGTIAVVWEAVRHWGSWMERQFIDPNPFILPQDDRRGQFEFWLPLFFYLWLWLNFFMVVPRNWGLIEHQRYPEQIILDAEPAATDVRFKTGAFLLLVCWLTIVVSLHHSIKHYCPRNRGIINRVSGFFSYIPLRFVLILPLALCVVAYQVLVAFDFAVSPLKLHTNLTAMYVGGYAPSLLILLIQCIWGFYSLNEDRNLQQQRRVRGEQINAELGLVRKPAWWRNRDTNERMRDRIARNVRELGGGNATAASFAERRAAAFDPVPDDGVDAVEMSNLGRSDLHRSGMGPRMMVPTKSDRRRTEQITTQAAALLFPGTNIPIDRVAYLMESGPPTESVPPPPYRDANGERGRPASRDGETGDRPGTVGRSASTGTTNSINAPPQQIRSMLDI